MADSKLTGLTAITELTTGDLLYAVDDVAGTPTSKKITADNVCASFSKQAAYASRPAASITGRIYFTTDGWTIERDDGSAWDVYGPVWPLTDPTTQSWSWVNQGSATITSAKGIEYLTKPYPGAASWDGSFRVKTAPTAPYTIDVLLGIAFTGGPAASCYANAGLIWRDSGTSKLAAWGPGSGQTLARYYRYWSNSTTYGGDYRVSQALGGGTNGTLLWLQLVDDNTNRIAKMSPDGVNWATFHTHARTSDFTPNQVGFGILTNGTSSGSVEAMSILSWKEY